MLGFYALAGAPLADDGLAASGGSILTPALYANTSTFGAPTVSPGSVALTPALYANTSTFGAPTVSPGSVTLAPTTFANDNVFYPATVTLEGGTTELTATIFVQSNQFGRCAVYQFGGNNRAPMSATSGPRDAVPTPPEAARTSTAAAVARRNAMGSGPAARSAMPVAARIG